MSLKKKEEGVNGLNGESITVESSRPVSAIAASDTSPRLPPGKMAPMGAEVDIQTQVHELGGAVSELSLGDTVRRIRILLDRLQLEAGAGKTFRQVRLRGNGL